MTEILSTGFINAFRPTNLFAEWHSVHAEVLFEAVRDFLVRKEYHSSAKLCGKTVIITGGNAGKQTALDLAARGAKIVIACRDVEKGKVAAVDIQKQVQNANIIVRHLDLASFSSIRRFTEGILMTELYIHILINNAVGKIHFSDIHLERGYNSASAYCHSKLASVLFTRELAKNLKVIKEF